MKSTTKRIVIGVTLGAILVGGGIGFFTAYAHQRGFDDKYGDITGEHRKHIPSRTQHKLSAAELAKHIADNFGVDESEVKKALESNKDPHEVGAVAMLAKLSEKSVSEVLNLKTDSNDWQTVGDNLDICRDEVRRLYWDMEAAHIEACGSIDKETAISLLQQGYRKRDIDMAGRVAQLSGNDIQLVLDMKRINNRWDDVARELGVTDETLYDIQREHSKYYPERPAKP